MDGKVTVIHLVVTDQARSLEFFTEKVGFEKKTDITPPGGSRWVTVSPHGETIELSLWQVGSAVDPSQKVVAQQWAPATSPPIVFQVPDCKKEHARLSARGVEFLLAPLEHPWGTTATFQDPDGNLFSMNQPPGPPRTK
jgi:predicted enzyme related to lactoylglutathione lyase